MDAIWNKFLYVAFLLCCVAGWRRKGHRNLKTRYYLCVEPDTLVTTFSLQNMLVTKCVVAIMPTRIQCCHPLWCNALRHESKSCSSLLIGLITLVSAIIYCVQWHLAALISVTSALANVCRLLSQILTPVYKLHVLLSLSLMVTLEYYNITLHKKIFTLLV